MDEIERLNGMLANDPDNTEIQDEINDAEGETQGLRDARDTARTNLDPVLKSQGQDEYYAKKALEYVAYTNWKNSNDLLEGARESLTEAEGELPDLEEEYGTAEYNLGIAKS